MSAVFPGYKQSAWAKIKSRNC